MRQHLGHAKRHGDVGVVPARVFDALHSGLVRHVDELGNGQRVHVRADGDHFSWAPAFENADHAGPADAGPDFIEPQRPEPIGDQRGGAGLSIPELGMLVDVAPRLDDLRMQVRRQPVDVGTLSRRNRERLCR